MQRVATILFLATANFAWGHPGHGAPLFHWHGLDLGHLMVGVAVVAIAAFAVFSTSSSRDLSGTEMSATPTNTLNSTTAGTMLFASELNGFVGI